MDIFIARPDFTDTIHDSIDMCNGIWLKLFSAEINKQPPSPTHTHTTIKWTNSLSANVSNPTFVADKDHP